MDCSSHWAGIDTSTRTFSICIVDGAGEMLRQADLPADTTAVEEFLRCEDSLANVALETGTTSLHLARTLTARGFPVAIYDALAVHRFLQLKRNKTDTNDAQGLAEIARIGGPRIRPVYLKPLDLSVIRSKLVIRDRLIKMRKVNERALMSLLHTYGVRAGGRISSAKSLRRVVWRMVRSVERTYDVPIRELVAPLLRLSVILRQQELRLESELKVFAASNQPCRKFMEIPGVGVITSVSFVTAIGDPTRFRKAADVGAYLDSRRRYG